MTPAHDITVVPSSSAVFEGPEKLLEIWFAQTIDDLPDAASATTNRLGLRKVERSVWEDMLRIVKCKVLSVVEGTEMDAYLLSESSLFVFANRLILKTCGTTLNLLGLPHILEIARVHASLPSVYRCFYSRKAFMFPERQSGPHRDWNEETKFLDGIFPNGASYTVGKVNGDHWLLYLTNPDQGCPSLSRDLGSANCIMWQDYTVEILMSELAFEARRPFLSSSPNSWDTNSPSDHAHMLSSTVGITQIFPPHMTTLDAHSFSPCGYSANALVKWRDAPGNDERDDDTNTSYGREGYFTIHVTPEDGWSYASFECNVPVPSHSSGQTADNIPDLKTLVRRVVDIFQPGRLSLTVFISSEDNSNAEGVGDTAVDAAQRAFKAALTVPPRRGPADESFVTENGGERRLYRRTDKINYEFGGYDLAFASFELWQ